MQMNQWNDARVSGEISQFPSTLKIVGRPPQNIQNPAIVQVITMLQAQSKLYRAIRLPISPRFSSVSFQFIK
jgi:hypothetical protein